MMILWFGPSHYRNKLNCIKFKSSWSVVIAPHFLNPLSHLPSYSYDVVESIGVVRVEIVQFCLIHI